MNTPLRLSAVAALLAVATGASALDTELQHGGFVIGDDGSSKPSWLLLSGGLASKGIDQGWILHDDAVANLGGTYRYMGIGVTVNSMFAVGQDKTSSYPVTNPSSPTNNSYYGRQNKPGEFLQFETKLDWLFQINGVYGDNGPFMQIIPHIDYVTYPNQSSNPYARSGNADAENTNKTQQTWVGLDLWWATPIPGIELGTSQDWNLAQPGYRGSLGARQFYQAAPIDFQFWQIANYGNAEYKAYFVDSNKRGLSYSQVGGKAIVPMPWSDWWGYAKADWTYWLDGDARDNLGAMGRDVGDLVLSLGMEYRLQ